MDYPVLKEMTVFELAGLLKMAEESGDTDFRKAILLEFKKRDESTILPDR